MAEKEKAFRKIFDDYYQALCFYAGKLVKDLDDAKDIVQEVFVAFWEDQPEFPDRVALKAYLYTTVHHACLNHIKAQQIHDRHHQLIREESSEVEDSNYLTDRVESETMWQLMQAIDSLPEECQKVFRLSYIDELDIQSVAEKLNITTHTVKSQRTRAKQLLRDRLKDLYPLFACIFFS